MRPPPWPMSSPPDGCRQKLANAPSRKKQKMAGKRAIRLIGQSSASIYPRYFGLFVVPADEFTSPSVGPSGVLFPQKVLVLLGYRRLCFESEQFVVADAVQSSGRTQPRAASKQVFVMNAAKPLRAMHNCAVLKELFCNRAQSRRIGPLNPS